MYGIVIIYAELVKKGFKSIDEVPENLKEEVQNLLKVIV